MCIRRLVIGRSGVRRRWWGYQRAIKRDRQEIDWIQRRQDIDHAQQRVSVEQARREGDAGQG